MPVAQPGFNPLYLMTDLPAMIAKAPVSFAMQAQLAEPEDQTKDPSQPWPEGHKVVTLGTITIDRAVVDSAAAEKALLFLPSNLPDGIEMSDDPLIDTRNQAYAVSFGKRSQ